MVAWRSRMLLGSLVPLALCAWLYAHRGQPYEFLILPDEMEYAELARNIARGEGFTSGLIYPIELEFGIGREHPNLIRPPGWPLLLAGAFALFGANEPVAHGLLLVLYCACVLASGALAARQAGPAVGFCAGLAVAMCPAFQALALVSSTELLFALTILAVFLLVQRGAAPALLGAACGLAYLTRYNGIVLLPVALLACAGRERRVKALAACAAGFALVALPWWVRNLTLTGNPFFTFYYDAVRVPAGMRGTYTRSLMHYLDPSSAAAQLPSPGEKAWEVLPTLILLSPFLSANLVAFLGLGVAAWHRQRVSLYALLCAALWTVAIAFVLPRGRYFAPLFPVVIALGAAGWQHLGRWPGAIGAVGVLLASLLPPLVPPAPDLAFLQAAMRTPRPPTPPAAWQHCISAESLVFAEDASQIAWKTDATTIWLTATESDFWQVVERFPVDFVYISARRDLLTPRFHERFERRRDCGEHLYQRRPG